MEQRRREEKAMIEECMEQEQDWDEILRQREEEEWKMEKEWEKIEKDEQEEEEEDETESYLSAQSVPFLLLSP
jgi:hypothetical protein